MESHGLRGRVIYWPSLIQGLSLYAVSTLESSDRLYFGANPMDESIIIITIHILNNT